MAGNNNPAQMLPDLSQFRGSDLVSSRDPALMQALGLDAQGQPLPNPNGAPAQGPSQLLGRDPGTDAQDSMGANRATTLNNSIALEYDATKGDEKPIGTVVAELKKGVFAGADEAYLGNQLQKIVENGKGRINYALAGKILERSQGQGADPNSFGAVGEWFSRRMNASSSGLIGSAERDVGGGRVIKDDLVDHFTKEVSTGLADVNLSEAKRIDRAKQYVAGSQKAYTDSVLELQKLRSMAASGNLGARSALPNFERKVAAKKRDLDLTLAAGAADTLAAPNEQDPEAVNQQAADKFAEAARNFYARR